jgi:hydrogenase expression/formation protein HypE
LVLRAAPDTRCMRDATRGGLVGVLNELAGQSTVGITIEQRKVPVRREVMAACDLLGLDPFYVANEGKLVACVPANSAEAVVSALRTHPLGQAAQVIGEVHDRLPGKVTVRTEMGGERIAAPLYGEQLPRIC